MCYHSPITVLPVAHNNGHSPKYILLIKALLPIGIINHNTETSRKTTGLFS